VDISLGVMRNGVGSVSTQDVWLTLGDVNFPGTPQLRTMLENAMHDGRIIEIQYWTRRIAVCAPSKIIIGVHRVD
jgi:hypothetical protein